ncbi:MAG: flavin reductase family protein [Candidatus Hodarchaeota archaeon]
MEKEVMEDIKKYQKAEKLKKWRDEVEPIPWYYDGLENLCDRIHPGKQKLQLTDIELISHDTKLYRFISNNPKKPLAPFRAGQYIGLSIEIDNVRTIRPYSLVSSPNQLAYYELGIRKKLDGFVSPYLIDNAKVGDIFEATEPMGNFYHNPIFHGKNLVFIAGGCGITPFVSILRDISERVLPLNVWLLFGCLTEKDILFRDFLEDIQKKRPNIKVKYILSEADSDWQGECGFITKDKIKEFVGSFNEKFYYIVGNRPMYLFIDEELKKLGIPRQRIIYEAFGAPDDITQVIGWPKEINISKKIKVTVKLKKYNQKSQRAFEVLCSEPLLNSLERELGLELQLDSGCRSGACALCRTKLNSGKIFIPPEVTIREVDRDFGFIHPCISYPLTDIDLDLTLT